MKKQHSDIKVSIVTPSYNQGRFIEKTILSILSQTYENIEYIVVDGGSTDDTLAVLDKYKDKIDIIISEKDKGQADAINKGFRLASGKLVGWLNSDDVFYPECVEKIVDLYSEKRDGAIYYCPKLDWINEEGEYLTQRRVWIENRDYLLNNNYSLIQQGSFYPKQTLHKIGYLNVNNYYCMDLALWLDLLKHGPIYAVKTDKSLSGFRIYQGTKTDSGGCDFLKNINKVLTENGAKWYSKNKRRIFFYSLKTKLKKVWEH